METRRESRGGRTSGGKSAPHQATPPDAGALPDTRAQRRAEGLSTRSGSGFRACRAGLFSRQESRTRRGKRAPGALWQPRLSPHAGSTVVRAMSRFLGRKQTQRLHHLPVRNNRAAVRTEKFPVYLVLSSGPGKHAACDCRFDFCKFLNYFAPALAGGPAPLPCAKCAARAQAARAGSSGRCRSGRFALWER